MVSLNGRLKSKSISEKLNALYYVMHLLVIGYCLYFFVFNVYLNESKIVLVSDKLLVTGLFLTLVFSLTTIGCHRDYMNIKKYHKNTLDYYIADLNPSRGSLVGNIILDKTQFHEHFLSGILIFSMIFSAIVFFISLFSLSPFVFIAIYNLALITVSFYLGLSINLRVVDSEKLSEFDKIEDVSSVQKIRFRQSIIELLKTQNKIVRSDILKICIKYKEENSKDKEKKESDINYRSYKQKSEELGIK